MIIGIISKLNEDNRQERSNLTKHALDAGDSAAFLAFFPGQSATFGRLASSFFCPQAESTPAHTRVTQTVKRYLAQSNQKEIRS